MITTENKRNSIYFDSRYSSIRLDYFKLEHSKAKLDVLYRIYEFDIVNRKIVYTDIFPRFIEYNLINTIQTIILIRIGVRRA